MSASKEHMVGHIIGPNGKPQNVEFIAKKRPNLTEAERSEGIQRVDGRYPVGDPRRMFYVGDNVADDAQAIYDTGRTAQFIRLTSEMGKGRIATPIVFTNPIHFYGGGCLRPDLGAGGGKMIAFETDDATVEKIEVDGTGSTGTLTDNTYIFFGGDGTTQFERHSYRDNYIHDCNLSDGLTGASNLLVTHAIYVDQVDHVEVDRNHFNTVSGAAVFTRDIDGLSVDHNRIIDVQWYNVNLDSGTTNFTVNHNYFDCQLATGVFYGGMVNLMSLQTGDRNEQGEVHDNRFKGNVSYGTVIRALSIDNVKITNNVIKEWDFGTWSISDDISAIRVDTRGISTVSENGPSNNITIARNTMENPGTVEDHRAIYIGNQWQTARNPMRNIRIFDNEITSASTSLYFSEGIICHGFSGGMEDVYIYDNKVTVYGQTSPVVGGAIGFVATNSGGAVDRIYLGRNAIVGLGTPSGSQEVGFSIGAYATKVYNTDKNYIDNFFYGVRTLTNSGSVLEGLDRQDFDTNTTDTLFNVVLSKYEQLLFGSTTWDPGSISDGDEQTQTVTVTGAALGDFVEAVSFSLDVQDLELSAQVTVANQVTATLSNSTNGAIDLASGTLRVRVSKAGSGE